MRWLKAAAWLAGAVAAIALLVFAGTYVSYFIAAMQRPPRSPLSISCAQLAPPRANTVRVRFDIANSGGTDATWTNLALFAAGPNGRNLSDWGYAIGVRVPAHGRISEVVAVPLPGDYRDRTFDGVRCNVINAVFADGSQQSYGADTDTFP